MIQTEALSNALLPALGTAVLLYRLWPTRAHDTHSPPNEYGKNELSSIPLVSIIVPARNEEKTLPSLLASLRDLDYPACEVIVVDDCSTDLTAEVARSFGARVLQCPERPAGWIGKSWACQIGALASTGDLLLFTDADTVHEEKGLRRMVGFLKNQKLALASALPYHQSPSTWESLLGPFWLFFLLSSAPYQKSHQNRLFAIGQYLLFERTTYFDIDGHQAVRGSLAEDLDLARLVMAKGKTYGVCTQTPPFSVRMYPTLKDFCRGWIRLVRIGLGKSSLRSVLEVTAVFAALTSPLLHTQTLASRLGWYATYAMALMLLQRPHGRYSWIGATLYPVSLATFLGITVTAVWKSLTRQNIEWKGRAYATQENL